MLGLFTTIQYQETKQGVNTTISSEGVQVFKINIPVATTTHTSFFFTQMNTSSLSYYYCLTESDCNENKTSQLSQEKIVSGNHSYDDALSLIGSTNTLYIGDCYLFVKNINNIQGVYFVVDTADLIHERFTVTTNPRPIYETSSSSNIYNYYLLYYSCDDGAVNVEVSDTSSNVQIYFSSVENSGYLTSSCVYEIGQTACMEDFSNGNTGNAQIKQGLWRVTIKTSNNNSLDVTFTETNTTRFSAQATIQQTLISKSKMCNLYGLLDISPITGNTSFSSLTVSMANELQYKNGAITFYIFDDPLYKTLRSTSQEGVVQYQNAEYQAIKDLNSKYLYIIAMQDVSIDLYDTNKEDTTMNLLAYGDLNKYDLGYQITMSQVIPGANNYKQYYLTNGLYNHVDISDISSYDGTQTQLPIVQMYTTRSVGTATDFLLKPRINYEGIPFDDTNDNATIKQFTPTMVQGGQGAYMQVLAGDLYDGSANPIVVPKQSMLYSYIEAKNTGASQTTNATVNTVTDVLTYIQGSQVVTFKNNGYDCIYFHVEVSDDIVSAGGVKIEINGDTTSKIYIYASTQNPLPDKTDYEYVSDINSTQNNGHAELVLNITEDFYFGVYFQGNNPSLGYTNKVYVIPKDQSFDTLDEDTPVTYTIQPNQTIQYAVPVNGMQYNQQEAFLKIAYASSQITSQGPINYVITSSAFEGDIENCPQDIKLASGYLNAAKSLTDETSWFQNRINGYIYFTITSRDTSAQSIKFQISHPTIIPDNSKVFLPSAQWNYLYIDTDLRDQVIMTFSTSNTEKQILFYVCPFKAPFTDQPKMYDSCKDGRAYSDQAVNLSEYNLRTGRDFILINNLDVTQSMSVQMLQNQYVSLNQISELKTSTSGDHYFYTRLEANQFGKTLQLTINQCLNCIICASQTDHAMFTAFDYSGMSNIFCQAIVGNVSYDSQAISGQVYYLQQDVELDPNNKQPELYFIVKSMQQQGTSQSIQFRIDAADLQPSDTDRVVNMVYSKYDKTIVDGVVGYRQTNLDYKLNCNALSGDDYISLTVTPNITASPQFLMTSQYSVYVSLTDITPQLKDSYVTQAYHSGLTSVSIKKSDVYNQWCLDGSSIAHVYALVKANDFMTDIVPTVITLTSVDQQKVVNPSQFYASTEFKASVGQRRLAHFNVLGLPMSLTVTSCIGNPHMRAGPTDYYNRLPYSGQQQSDNGYTIYNSDSSHTQSQGDLVLQIKSGTRYMLTGDYIIEIEDDNADWTAHFKVGNDDISPGTPIRTISVGKDGNQLRARFAPATQVTKSSNQQDIEYALYILGNYKEEQDKHGNPYSGCGYTIAGYQLSDWETFQEYQDFFEIAGDLSNEAQQWVQSQNSDMNIYATVIVRDKNSQILNSYKQVSFNYNSIPEYAYKDKSGLTTGLIVGITIGVIVVICAIIGGIYFYKRKQAKNPYQFDNKVNWDE